MSKQTALSGQHAFIGFGQVWHSRLRPKRHAFSYPGYFLMLPLRSLHSLSSAENLSPVLAHNRRGALSFFDCDHGEGGHNALIWLDALLQREGILDADGEAWLQTYPRVWGYTFKPVSFWYCHRKDDSLRAVMVEVNNTFGERHCYLLDAPQYGQDVSASKVFHVSPFCSVSGSYRFRFMHTLHEGVRSTVARIDHEDADGPLLKTSISGRLLPLTATSVRHALWAYPAMTWGVVGRIHWQALKLWLKRVPFFRKPPPPETLVTR